MAVADYPTDESIPPISAETPRSDAPDDATATALRELWEDPPGFIGWFRAVQNDAVGGRIMKLAFLNFLIAGVFALLLRLQLLVPHNDFLAPDTFNGLFTMHGSTMMYMFIVPMVEGFAIMLLPFMLGNREMPFPRLGIFSYFTFMLGSLLFFSAFIVGTVPQVGWYAYVPLSNIQFTPGIATDYWLLALGVAEVAAIAAGIEIIVAILRMRAPGMSLAKLPLYAWAMLITATSILFAFTPLLVVSALLELDRKIDTAFFVPELGGSPLLWQHLFWIFGHPEVYIQFLPITGMLAMMIPVFVRRRIVGYTFVVSAMLSTGVLAFLLWVHHMFTAGLPTIILGIFSVASIFIGIPTGVQIFAYLATLIGGKPVWKTPFYFIVGFLVTFVLGGITGIMVGSVPFNWQAHDSYFIVAHLHYVLIGGVVFPIFGALYYWIPKWTGKLLDERLGKWNFWLMFVGFHIAFMPQHIVGLLGMPRRYYTYPDLFGWQIYNVISTIGAFILAIGVALFVINYFWSGKYGEDAGANPWGADSLEWATSSPAPNYGFSVLPLVKSRHPLWDQGTITAGTAAEKSLVQDLARWPTTWRAALISSVLDGTPQEIFRVSRPSLWPFVAACGLVVAFAAEIFSARLLALGGLITLLLALVGWHWPYAVDTSEEEERAFAEKHNIAVNPYGSHVVARMATGLFILLLFIALACVVFVYFFLRVENATWPLDGLQPPAPLWGIVGTLLAAASAGVLRWGKERIEAGSAGLSAALTIGLLLTTGAFAALLYDLSQLPFDWRINAYGSAFYLAAGYLLLFTLISFGRILHTLLHALRGVYTPTNAISAETTATFALWLTVAWVIVGGMIYLTPLL